jgi:predicted nucleotidyltransferase
MVCVQRDQAVAAATAIADAFVAAVRVPVKSVVLHGSLTFDDFVPGRSDVDLLVVVEEPLGCDDVDALVAAVAAADVSPAAGIDLHVVTSDVAAAPPRTPPVELYVGGHQETDLEVERKVEGVPDLLAELSMARARGHSLLGVTPRETIGEVDPEWIHERSVYWLTRWLTLVDDVRHAAFMVLTACRMWQFRLEGVHSSKTAAARWALARNASLVAVHQALRQRTVDATAPVAQDGIRTVLETALNEIRTRTAHDHLA